VVGNKVHRVFRVSRVHKVSVVSVATRVNRVTLDHKVQSVLKALKVRRVSKAPLVLSLLSPVLVVPKGTRVTKGMLPLSPDPKVNKAHEATRATLVIVVLLVTPTFPAHRVHRDRLVQREPKVTLVQSVLKDRLDVQCWTEQLLRLLVSVMLVTSSSTHSASISTVLRLLGVGMLVSRSKVPQVTMVKVFSMVLQILRPKVTQVIST